MIQKNCQNTYAFRFRRNDVGRSSVDGTVKVNEKFKIEKYSHVMHIVSNVYGKFKKNTSLLNGLLSGFPPVQCLAQKLEYGNNWWIRK